MASYLMAIALACRGSAFTWSRQDAIAEHEAISTWNTWVPATWPALTFSQTSSTPPSYPQATVLRRWGQNVQMLAIMRLDSFGSPSKCSCTIVDAGWPASSARGVFLVDDLGQVSTRWVMHRCAQSGSSGSWFNDGCDIPVGVLWRGTIVNALCYAVVFFAAVVIFRRSVRLARQTRGRCEHCGYQLKGGRTDAAGRRSCPECGATAVSAPLVPYGG